MNMNMNMNALRNEKERNLHFVLPVGEKRVLASRA